MGRSGWKLRIGAGTGLALGLALGLAALRAPLPGQVAPPAVSAPPPLPGALPDLDRLYDLDVLVLGEPAALPGLAGPGPLPVLPARGAAVPEPGAATLWILAMACACTLYLPARSW